MKSGALTPAETRVAQAYAGTLDQGFAAKKAGISQPGASKALQRPAVQAEIVRIQTEALFSEILPLAVAVHRRLLTDPKVPAGAQVQAVKLAYDRTLGMEGADKAKEPHEMTPDELARAINALERVAADRARNVTPAQGLEPAESGVFD